MLAAHREHISQSHFLLRISTTGRETTKIKAAAGNCRFQNTTGGGCGYFRNNPTSMHVNNSNDPIANTLLHSLLLEFHDWVAAFLSRVGL